MQVLHYIPFGAQRVINICELLDDINLKPAHYEPMATNHVQAKPSIKTHVCICIKKGKVQLNME
jgi:hypothetical protein